MSAQIRLLEEFTSTEQQNSKHGIALFSLKIALEHLITSESADVSFEPFRTKNSSVEAIKINMPRTPRKVSVYNLEPNSAEP
jgi:hypothetical protein